MLSLMWAKQEKNIRLQGWGPERFRPWDELDGWCHNRPTKAKRAESSLALSQVEYRVTSKETGFFGMPLQQIDSSQSAFISSQQNRYIICKRKAIQLSLIFSSTTLRSWRWWVTYARQDKPFTCQLWGKRRKKRWKGEGKRGKKEKYLRIIKNS